MRWSISWMRTIIADCSAAVDLLESDGGHHHEDHGHEEHGHDHEHDPHILDGPGPERRTNCTLHWRSAYPTPTPKMQSCTQKTRRQSQDTLNAAV